MVAELFVGVLLTLFIVSIFLWGMFTLVNWAIDDYVDSSESVNYKPSSIKVINSESYEDYLDKLERFAW